MAILLIIAALILIGIIILLLKRPGRTKRAVPAEGRFRDIGPGEPRPKQPRASGPD